MKIVAFGEVMMRLMPPDYKLLTQSDRLEFLFTGTGVNILSGLFQMGNEVVMSTILPNNNVGYAAAAHLRKLGINDKYIGYKGNHIGMYFIEMGVGRRPSQVTYMNREESSFGRSSILDYDFEKLLKGADCIHICGISLALNKNTRECAFNLASIAREKGIKVIFDCNFRPSLWRDDEREDAKKEYEKMLNLSDIVFATDKDAELLLGIEYDNRLSGIEKKEYLLNKMREKYSIKTVLGTIRHNEEENQKIQGYMVDDDGITLSKIYKVIVYDRVGGGDGFACGAIHGILNGYTKNEIVNFATCSGVLAHTTYGDSPVMGINHIRRLMNDEYIDIIR